MVFCIVRLDLFPKNLSGNGLWEEFCRISLRGGIEQSRSVTTPNAAGTAFGLVNDYGRGGQIRNHPGCQAAHSGTSMLSGGKCLMRSWIAVYAASMLRKTLSIEQRSCQSITGELGFNGHAATLFCST